MFFVKKKKIPRVINRYNAEVYKKSYKAFLIVFIAIPHFCQGRKITNLIDKIKRISKK